MDETEDLKEFDYQELRDKIKLLGNQNELFILMRALLDSIDVHGLDKDENWLVIAQYLESLGYVEMAETFRVANQQAVRLLWKK